MENSLVDRLFSVAFALMSVYIVSYTFYTVGYVFNEIQEIREKAYGNVETVNRGKASHHGR